MFLSRRERGQWSQSEPLAAIPANIPQFCVLTIHLITPSYEDVLGEAERLWRDDGDHEGDPHQGPQLQAGRDGELHRGTGPGVLPSSPQLAQVRHYKIDYVPQNVEISICRQGLLVVPSHLDHKMLLNMSVDLGLDEVASEIEKMTKPSLGDWIKLDVGGTIFKTSLTTLTRKPDSLLGPNWQFQISKLIFVVVIVVEVR